MKDIKMINDSQFADWLMEVKQLVKKCQLKAVVRVNTEMLKLYWEIGKKIVTQQAESTWGTGFYKTMSSELREEFPGIDGFSVTNLKYMKKFYLFYSESKRQQLVDDFEKIYIVPWGHHILIFTKCENIAEAWFYQASKVMWQKNC